jgi:hypothetical protein
LHAESVPWKTLYPVIGTYELELNDSRVRDAAEPRPPECTAAK